jgi:hypothetical protein
MAPVISGRGNLDVTGGSNGSPGRIRLEAFQFGLTREVSPSPSFGTPFMIFLPASVPTVRVARIAGQDVPPNPRGSFITPDVTMDTTAPVTLEVEATQVPPGTVVQLDITSEDGTVQTVATTPLTGTLELSTATAQFTFSHGFSRIFVQASWTP